MKKYLAELIENLAQRLLSLACNRASEALAEIESRAPAPSAIYRASLPAIEYIEN